MAMHSVGIKRVFWTNADGTWEGAKVRDLVDAMEGSVGGGGGGICNGVETGQEERGVFVTKHEILRMRQIMMGNV
jgi:hypothetical protein